jgi:hypothetical protein
MLRIFGPKRHEIRGDWRKLHSEELHYMECLRAEPVAHGIEEEGRKPEGKRPL